MKERFREVTDELLSLAGMPASKDADLYSSVTLALDGITFSLMHDAASDEPHMTMLCDFGRPEEKTRSEVIKALLAANSSVLTHAGRESFCMNPVSGHILASSILPMPKGSAKLLFDVLRQYAQQARKWQQAYALGTDTGAIRMAS